MAESENKTIVFIETKRRVDEITRKMKRDGWPAVCIHGDKTQQERDWVLQGRRITSTYISYRIMWNVSLIVRTFCRFQIRQGTNPRCYRRRRSWSG